MGDLVLANGIGKGIDRDRTCFGKTSRNRNRLFRGIIASKSQSWEKVVRD